MGVYIKGVEMPKEYGRCIVIFPDGRVTTEFGSQVIATAVPVQEHGRLIDADGEVVVNVTMMPGGKCRVDFIAPTVIPAESDGD